MQFDQNVFHVPAAVEPFSLDTETARDEETDEMRIRGEDTVVIPDLFVSFVAQRPKPNPFHEEIKKESIAWMMRYT